MPTDVLCKLSEELFIDGTDATTKAALQLIGLYYADEYKQLLEFCLVQSVHTAELFEKQIQWLALSPHEKILDEIVTIMEPVYQQPVIASLDRALSALDRDHPELEKLLKSSVEVFECADFVFHIFRSCDIRFPMNNPVHCYFYLAALEQQESCEQLADCMD